MQASFLNRLLFCLLAFALGQGLAAQSTPPSPKQNTRTPSAVTSAVSRQFYFGGVRLSFGTERQEIFDVLEKQSIRTVRDDRPDYWIAYTGEGKTVIGILHFDRGKLVSVMKSWYLGDDAKTALSTFYDACHSAEAADPHPDKRFFLTLANDQPEEHLKSIVLDYAYHSVTLEFGVSHALEYFEVKEDISSWY
jgi:hypothetical protein